MFEYQDPAVRRTTELLTTRGLVVNTSDTGTGKTYVCAKALQQVQHNGVFVIAPKSVLTMWRQVLADHGVKVLDVLNIEKLRHAGGKTKWYHDSKWWLPEGAVVIIDEAHRGSADPKAKSAVVIARLKAAGCALIPQSATLADDPLKMRATGYLMGLHGFVDQSFYEWCRQHGCRYVKRRVFDQKSGTYYERQVLEFSKGKEAQEAMARIHDSMAPFTVRLRIADIPEFPECDTQVQLYDLDTKYRAEIQKAYAEMSEALKAPQASVLAQLIRARQRSELMKVALLHDLATQYLEEHRSVVVFVNFTETLVQLHQRLGGVVIYGQQSAEERRLAIAAFQSNEAHVCIANCDAGGVGVSLHDVRHERPRVALITPPWSATVVTQVLGRVWRAGGTKALQIFVLAANTIEERIHKAVKRKLTNLAALNDNDFQGLEDL